MGDDKATREQQWRDLLARHEEWLNTPIQPGWHMGDTINIPLMKWVEADEPTMLAIAPPSEDDGRRPDGRCDSVE